MLFIIAMVPAFPTLPFLIVALILAGVGYLLMENEKSLTEIKAANKEVAAEDIMERGREESANTFQVEPISVEVGYGLIPLVDEGNEDNLISHITKIRRQCSSELGIIVNPIRIRDNLQLGPNDYVIKIKGNKVAGGQIYINRF